MYSGKIVIITGCSRGLGLEITNYFLERNAQVIGLSRNSPDIRHNLFHHIPVDLRSPESIMQCFKKEITKRFSRIDIVINNAGVLTAQYAMIMPMENALSMVNVNLLGVFFVSREASKLMRSIPYGRIINIGSMAAKLEPVGDSIYAACKAAVSTMANVMAKELSKFGITCNTVGVTAIDTDMLRQLPKDKLDKIINELPIPRYANTEDVFNVIDFFCSERSSYITAQTIYLGGIN